MNRKIIISGIIIIITFLLTITISKAYYDKSSKTNISQSTNKTTKVIETTTNIIKEEKTNIENNEKSNNFNIKLTFVGDTMLASLKDITTPGSFNEYANTKEPSYFLSKVSKIFKNDDFTIVNLENVLTDKSLPETNKNTEPAYWYKSKTDNIKILSSSSVEGVSVSNNHTFDYGEEGKNDTINTIINANMEYGDYNHIMYFTKNNYKVAIICKGLWIESQTKEIIKLIKEAEKNSDYQIVFFHGGKEKIHTPEEWKINATRKLTDNGADLVVGSHPHVLQPREIYKGKEIIYSLGNFCYGGNKNPENRTIIYQMNLTIDTKTYELTKEESNIIPCYVYTTKTNNYQPAPIEDETIKNKVLNFMNGKEDSPV